MRIGSADLPISVSAKNLVRDRVARTCPIALARSSANCLEMMDWVVAGEGFEPTTSGL